MSDLKTSIPDTLVEQPAKRSGVLFARKFAASVLILGFLLVLVLPLTRTDFKAVPTISPTENRYLNTFPNWSWDGQAVDAFPAKFDAAFNDHFGFRSFLVLWHSRFKVNWLNVSPVEDVTLGKQGWLYYTDSIKEYRGNKGIPKREAARWVDELKSKQAWCAARNIRYMLVVAPNKEDVYPEYLPDTVCRMREHRYFDDILAQLGDNSGVEVLDLREILRNAKHLGLVYERTDTHWSQLGAFLATNEILLRLQKWHPELQPEPLTQRTLSPQRARGGDLAGMIGLQDEMLEDRLIFEAGAHPFEPSAMRFQVDWPKDALKDAPMAFESKGDQQRRLTLLITGDSFGRGLMRFLPEHFQRVTRLRPQTPYSPWFQALIPALVEAEKPDVYLDVFCARSLKHPPKVPVGGK